MPKTFDFGKVAEPVFTYVGAEGKTHSPKLWDLVTALRTEMAAATRAAKEEASKTAEAAGSDPEPVDDLAISRQVVGKIVGIPDITQHQAIAFQAAIAEAVTELDELKKMRQLSAS
jgi:hypothetical protein